jgi:hypothetical protein
VVPDFVLRAAHPQHPRNHRLARVADAIFLIAQALAAVTAPFIALAISVTCFSRRRSTVSLAQPRHAKPGALLQIIGQSRLSASKAEIKCALPRVSRYGDAWRYVARLGSAAGLGAGGEPTIRLRPSALAR